MKALLPKETRLFPESFDCSQMYYANQPYAYWCESIGEWVLYKEYNDYTSICHPNDCLRAINYDDVIKLVNEFFPDRLLHRVFKQRSLNDNTYNFCDFEYKNIENSF